MTTASGERGCGHTITYSAGFDLQCLASVPRKIEFLFLCVLSGLQSKRSQKLKPQNYFVSHTRLLYRLPHSNQATQCIVAFCHFTEFITFFIQPPAISFTACLILTTMACISAAVGGSLRPPNRNVFLRLDSLMVAGTEYTK